MACFRILQDAGSIKFRPGQMELLVSRLGARRGVLAGGKCVPAYLEAQAKLPLNLKPSLELEQ